MPRKQSRDAPRIDIYRERVRGFAQAGLRPHSRRRDEAGVLPRDATESGYEALVPGLHENCSRYGRLVKELNIRLN